MKKAVMIDANVFNSSLRQEVSDAIVNGGLMIISSQHSCVDKELRRASRSKYKQFFDAGRIHFVCSDSVDRKHKRLLAAGGLASNDHHIIAVAIVSCADTLVTNERKTLIADFRNVRNINDAAGCIKDARLKPKSGQKIIRNDLARGADVMRLLDNSEAVGMRCECLINGGGCP